MGASQKTAFVAMLRADVGTTAAGFAIGNFAEANPLGLPVAIPLESIVLRRLGTHW